MVSELETIEAEVDLMQHLTLGWMKDETHCVRPRRDWHLRFTSLNFTQTKCCLFVLSQVVCMYFVCEFVLNMCVCVFVCFGSNDEDDDNWNPTYILD